MQSLSTYIEKPQINSVNMEKGILENRVTLKRITRDDLSHFYLWASDPEVAKSMTWEAYTSKEDAQKFLIDIAENHPWFKAICVDGTPIGAITLSPGKGCFSCRAELGIVLAKTYWGKNIATIAIKLALQNGFKDLNIQRIEAFVDPDNIASQRALTKAGMLCETLMKNYIIFKGTLRDRYIFSYTKV